MAKIYKDDGTFYYYYYKKKIGRKKKRGRKTAKKAVEKEKKYKVWDFKIIQCDFKKQTKFIGYYHDMPEVESVRKELEAKNKSVELPKIFINNKRKTDSPTQKYEFESEYVILKRIRKEDESNESLIRNQYGKLVKHVTTSDRYYIYDKFPCKIEETFWVYGCNPKSDRKPIKWIYEEFIDGFIDNVFDVVQIYVYNNKVIFRYPDKYIEFVIAKNTSEAIRIYNFLEEKYKKRKKQVIFTGFVGGYSDRTKTSIELLKEKTGWTDNKLRRTRT